MGFHSCMVEIVDILLGITSSGYFGTIGVASMRKQRPYSVDFSRLAVDPFDVRGLALPLRILVNYLQLRLELLGLLAQGFDVEVHVKDHLVDGREYERGRAGVRGFWPRLRKQGHNIHAPPPTLVEENACGPGDDAFHEWLRVRLEQQLLR